MKKLTILIPSYNHKKYIGELFECIESLPIELFDVLIIDDCSNDGSDKIIESYATSKSNVSCILKEQNKGLINSIKVGISHIRTEYFFLIASDDLFSPEAIAEALQYMIEKPEISFCIFGGYNFSEDGSIREIYGERHKRFFSLSPANIYKKMFYNHPAPILLQSSIFKTELFHKNPSIVDPNLKFDDYQIFIKLFRLVAENNVGFGFNNGLKIVKYRHHENNTYKDYKKMFSMFEEVYDTCAPTNAIACRSKAMCWYLYFSRSVVTLNISFIFFFLKNYRFSYLKYFHIFLRDRFFNQ
ncbi:glycosyltransferase family 2 protein [Gallaecimonas kandeliae]|uniref:glycosyltransferase family 2 protein n=1 Tax=Gallaecimonas kandeliae TaxID=3029055 RepID=UPI002648236F|nr:glycosyltransferase family 2 protein [Gallaecimonas kandeliae]WKE66789.1 glycosyltransferase family 2 protein [Gallaecimonas kandeliae]